MNTSHRQTVLSNPDEHISPAEEVEATTNPYRKNSFIAVVEPKPFNWGPLLRTGKLGLVAFPLIAQLALLPLIVHAKTEAAEAGLLFIMLNLIVQGVCIIWLSEEFQNKSRMYGAITFAWWPVALMAWLVRSRILFYPITRPIQYIRSGE